MFKAIIDVIVVMVTATIHQLPMVVFTEISIMWLKMKIAVKTYLRHVAFPRENREVLDKDPPQRTYKTRAELNAEFNEISQKLQTRIDEYEKKHNITL
jgi:hypothetical protein